MLLKLVVSECDLWIIEIIAGQFKHACSTIPCCNITGLGVFSDLNFTAFTFTNIQVQGFFLDRFHFWKLYIIQVKLWKAVKYTGFDIQTCTWHVLVFHRLRCLEFTGYHVWKLQVFQLGYCKPVQNDASSTIFHTQVSTKNFLFRFGNLLHPYQIFREFLGEISRLACKVM